MYVMIDWHVLTPGDPMDESYLIAGLDDPNMPEAFLTLRDDNPDWHGPQVFFAYMAQKYGMRGNILYEPANEPNRLGAHADRFTVWSERLKPYYESVISVIRMFDENGIIICGTDNWSQYVDGPIHDPIDDPNVMYAMHFYAGTHDAGYEENPNFPGTTGAYWLREMTDNALDHGLAIFCTEWGTSLATGDGGPFIDFAARWVEYMEDRGISWTAWSMARKYEVSAAFNFQASAHPEGAWLEDELTISGHFYRAMIKGDPVPMYTEDLRIAANPADAVHNGDVLHLPRFDPGSFVSLPFTFESGTREGWAKEGGSAIHESQISIGIAETNALMLYFEFQAGQYAWEDGARLGSPHFPRNAMDVESAAEITAFTMEVFLEDGKATKGDLQLAVVLVPDGGSYWHEVTSEGDRITLDPINGGEIIESPTGATLRKFTITLPFSTSDYAGDNQLRVRNIVLALYNNENNESDYAGFIFYDNIGFVY
jgi:endoglucanase